jgi:hypothetical protein
MIAPVKTEPVRTSSRLGLVVLAAALTAYVATAGGSMATTDAVVAYDLTQQMVDRGSVALSGDLIGNPAYRGADGRFYSPFGLAQSIWNVPFYVGGRLASRALGGDPVRQDMMAKAVVALGNTVPAALCVYVMWLFATRWGASHRAAVFVAAVVGFATSLWPYSKFGFNVPLSALLLAAAHYAAWRAADTSSRAQAFLSGLWIGWAILTRHEFALGAGVLACWLGARAREGRWRRLAWWGAGLLPGAVIWVGYNYIRFGSPLDAGYLRDQVPAWGASVLAGVAGLLFSPAASIFLYSPIAVLGVWALVRVGGGRAGFARFLLVEVALFTVFYAQLGNWIGGRSYGPRYLVPFLPLICLPLAGWWLGLRGWKRRLTVLIAACSLVAQIPGVLVDFATVRVAHAQRVGAPGQLGSAWLWEYAPLALNTRAAMVAVPLVARHLAGLEPAPRITERAGPSDRTYSQQFAFSLDFWWIYLFYLGAWSGRAAAAAGAALLACFALLARAAWVLASRLDSLSAAGASAGAAPG